MTACTSKLHEKTLLKQIDALFHPESIAVVGVPRGMKMGRLFLTALLDQNFPGTIYPVNPSATEIDGLKTYPAVSEIPGPVDLAIVLVPHDQTLSIVKECAEKKVKGVVLFTAGYGETGTPEGKDLEEKLVNIAQSAGMRLVGPNCMGLYSPESGLSFFPELSRTPGNVGIVSHSGSLANIMGRMGKDRGIRFSKVVSLGNECDLTGTDFLAYLGSDPDTRVIGTYLENIRNGAEFLHTVKEISGIKPVILWKAGRTPEGARAAASHTGALAGRKEVWEGVVRQSGGIEVIGFEAWLDTLMAFSYLPDTIGCSMAIISGPGGFAVAAAEACGMAGLTLANLSRETQQLLGEIIAQTGTSVRNPIDIGLSGSMNKETVLKAARTAAADENVDALLVVGTGMTPEDNRFFAHEFSRIQHAFEKPFLPVAMPGFDEMKHTDFFEAGFPVFSSVERAMQAYGRIWRYRQWKSLTLNLC
ncbi:MAG: CoA-binding protein [Desulfobacterales bacterium]